MHVYVNGREQEIRACFLAELLTELGFQGDWLAIAINDEVITAVERESYKICESDRIEILSPMQGG
ncbi:MAG: sulfur carrier protein [Candidatus Tokpelaia sp. JSC188]|nr:MAG: sulfur carrier protein [Candidatus Tokpelaia sp. JSC188]